MKIFLDPGHGMGNITPGLYDTGNVWTDPATKKELNESDIVMEWANCLRGILQSMGYGVVRSRKDALDPAPLKDRVKTAKAYKCDVFVSLHCNAFNGKAKGSETFFRGERNRGFAKACNDAVVKSLGTLNRGIKPESESQHKSLAVLAFPNAVLIELGFMDHPADRAALLDDNAMHAACVALAEVITTH